MRPSNQEILDRAETMFRLAYATAVHSPDLSNQTGALVTNHDFKVEIIENGDFPAGVAKTDQRLSVRPDKYDYIEHAERQIVYAAARLQIPIAGQIVYCPWAACFDCARALIQARVGVVVVHEQRMNCTPPRWVRKVAGALEMMEKEANIPVLRFDGRVRGCTDIRVNGEAWNPSDPPTQAGNWSTGYEGQEL